MSAVTAINVVVARIIPSSVSTLRSLFLPSESTAMRAASQNDALVFRRPVIRYQSQTRKLTGKFPLYGVNLLTGRLSSGRSARGRRGCRRTGARAGAWNTQPIGRCLSILPWRLSWNLLLFATVVLEVVDELPLLILLAVVDDLYSRAFILTGDPGDAACDAGRCCAQSGRCARTGPRCLPRRGQQILNNPAGRSALSAWRTRCAGLTLLRRRGSEGRDWGRRYESAAALHKPGRWLRRIWIVRVVRLQRW